MTEDVLWALSGVNPKGEPFVQLRKGGAQVPGVVSDASVSLAQMTPAEARQFGQSVLECAEAAETDAFLWHFFKAKMGLEDKQVLMFIRDFRKWRESHAGAVAPAREDFAGDQFKAQREKLEEGQ